MLLWLCVGTMSALVPISSTVNAYILETKPSLQYLAPNVQYSAPNVQYSSKLHCIFLNGWSRTNVLQEILFSLGWYGPIRHCCWYSRLYFSWGKYSESLCQRISDGSSSINYCVLIGCFLGAQVSGRWRVLWSWMWLVVGRSVLVWNVGWWVVQYYSGASL